MNRDTTSFMKKEFKCSLHSNNFKARKETFLRAYKSRNPKSINKYRRVTVSPIRYAGGKSLAVGHIIELLPDNITRVISPFLGGGSVEIAMCKFLGLEVFAFDIFDILINYWKFQIQQPHLLYEKLAELKPDQETYDRVRNILKDHWEKRCMLDSLSLAVYFFYNFNLSYGPGFLGWTSKIYLDQKRYNAMLQKVRDFQVKNLYVECATFEDVLARYPNDFFYCDPPYYIGPDSKMFKGIYPMRNIPIHHNGFKHERLRDLLLKHKGGFILSYNDCPTIREWYKDFQQTFPRWQYTMGQGETRIGKNRLERGVGDYVKESHEILIYKSPSV